MSKLSATKVSQKLGVSTTMLNLWYYWYNHPDFTKPQDTPPLPPYEQANPRGIRYWNPEDIKALKRFQKWIPKGRGGVMGEATRRYRGQKTIRKEIV